MSEPVYTTGEIAKFVGVNFRTVIRWIERGQLEGYKLPGRGDHRVTQSNLIQFMRENDIPLPAELEELTKRVLVVDDDEPMAKAIARVFKRDGWEVRLAHDGFEAGAELGSFKPTLMTLDLKMPYMDGQKVLEMTRNKFGLTDVKILVISAQSESELQAALDGGADAVLAKPFDNEQLLCLVEQWFSSE